MKIINLIDRENLESLIVNKGQNQVNAKMTLFAEQVPSIAKLEDLKTLDQLFYSNFTLNKSTPKFECTSAEIFERTTYSGCSDIGLALAPILRLKGIPTVYVESTHIDWIKEVQNNSEQKELMQGHIFLEIYLGGIWYLYDPTFHLVYLDYDYNNPFLPRGYVTFAKGLNCHELGIHNVQDEKRVGTAEVKDFDLEGYDEPNYQMIDLRRKFEKTI